MKLLSIEQLQKRAEKALKVKETMDDAFPAQYDQNLLLCIMAVIQDAYKEGQVKGSTNNGH
jgi:hypothetical protein